MPTSPNASRARRKWPTTWLMRIRTRRTSHRRSKLSRRKNGRLAGEATSARLLRDELDAARERLVAAAKLESEVERLRDRTRLAGVGECAARTDETAQTECLAMRRRLAELEEELEAGGSTAEKNSAIIACQSQTRQQQAELRPPSPSPTRSSPASLDAARSRLAELTRTNSELEAAAAAAASASSSSFPSATVPPMPDGVGESLADCLRADAQAEAALADERSAARRRLRDAESAAADLSDKLSAAEDRCRRLERELELAKSRDCWQSDRQPSSSWRTWNSRTTVFAKNLIDKRQSSAAEVATLRSAAAEAADARAAADKEARRLRRVADAATAAAEASATEAASARDEATSLKAQLAELDCSAAELHELEKERLQLLSSLSLERGHRCQPERAAGPKRRCQALVSQERRQAANTGATVAALESRIESIQTEMEQARTRLEAEEEARRRAELALDEAEAGVGGASGRHMQSAKNAALETERSNHAVTLSAVRDRAASSEERLSAAQDELSDLHRQLAAANLASSSPRLHSLDKDHARLSADYDQLRRLHDRWLPSWSPPAMNGKKLLNELKQKKSQLKERDAENDYWVKLKDSSICRRRCRGETKDLAEDSRRCIQLQAELASLSSEQTRLQSARDRIEAESRSLTSELTSTRRRLAEKESALAETESELAKLRNLLSETRSYRASERQLPREMLASLAEAQKSIEERMMCQYRESGSGQQKPSSTARRATAAARVCRPCPLSDRSVPTTAPQPTRRASAFCSGVIDAAAAASASAFKSSSWSERVLAIYLSSFFSSGGGSSGDQPHAKPPTRGAS
uniref:ANK_REP_REGION domain-containing protein n=1 Tax=Macrostomum lignano TaxID=282301 RepID=A0A1I8FLR5_9PLAT